MSLTKHYSFDSEESEANLAGVSAVGHTWLLVSDMTSRPLCRLTFVIMNSAHVSLRSEKNSRIDPCKGNISNQTL